MRKALSSRLASQGSRSSDGTLTAKFAPRDPQKVLLFVGQDTESVTEYVEKTKYGSVVTGVTSYTALSERSGKSLNGVSQDIGVCPVDYGAGVVDASAMLARLPHAALSLGLDITGADRRRIAAGKHDKSLQKLASFLKGIAPRPVFLRIGYEADGPWNKYTPATDYIAAFRYIAEYLREREGVSNMVIVWQVATSRHTGGADIMKWWPGEDVIDWLGGSYFEYERSAWKSLFALARKHGKPVFICESAPQGYDIPRCTHASAEGSGEDTRKVSRDKIWSNWYSPFFKFIYSNRDVVRAVAYINCNWNSQPMWNSGLNGYWGDTRVSADDSQAILPRWEEHVGDETMWLRASSHLLDELVTE